MSFVYEPRISIPRILSTSARRRCVRFLTTCVTVLTIGVLPKSAAAASRPYVTLRDDGTLAGKVTNPTTVLRSVMKTYGESGQPVPDVISLWTGFAMDKNSVGTLFVPARNDVSGIGLEKEYGGAGVFDGKYGSLRCVLLHNDVTRLEQRATLQSAPVGGFGEYLFLLELSHIWGPALRVPGEATAADVLIGFPFHWSFWMDAGGSPAGGNAWKDNGDGTFTASGQKPGTVEYSMLDLYAMGLAEASEVPPFGVLENAVPPPDIEDPFTHSKLGKSSFPWFADSPLTVPATRRTITIDEVIAANGQRKPSASESPKSFTLGIVLMVDEDATEEEVTKAETAMNDLAPKLAPTFERATRGRGAMTVVTSVASDDPPPVEVEDPAPEPAASPAKSSSGCAASSLPHAGGWLSGLLLVASALLVRRRPRR